jgi:hypothetical protein
MTFVAMGLVREALPSNPIVVRSED